MVDLKESIQSDSIQQFVCISTAVPTLYFHVFKKDMEVNVVVFIISLLLYSCILMKILKYYSSLCTFSGKLI